MQSVISKKSFCLIVTFVVLGCFGIVHADDQAVAGTHYRQEVRDHLKKVQANLDFLLASHQLTADQYQTESERIRQLRLQMHVDAQEDVPMTKDERSTDFNLIRQISQEASQWAVANSSMTTPVPTPPPTNPAY